MPEEETQEQTSPRRRKRDGELQAIEDMVDSLVNPEQPQPAPRRRKRDSELQAIEDMIESLEKFDQTAQARIMGYLNCRLTGPAELKAMAQETAERR